MAKTKIFVIQLKEIIYTVIFAALGILLILLLIFMFSDKKEAAPTMKQYIPGKWTSSFTLNDTALNLEVVVDKSHIKSVRIVNIDDSITTLFPLVKPSLEAIRTQLYNDVPIDQLTLTEDSKYTETVLIDAIKAALDKASASTDSKK